MSGLEVGMTKTTNHDGTRQKTQVPDKRLKKPEQHEGGPPARPHMTVTAKPEPSPHDVESPDKDEDN